MNVVLFKPSQRPAALGVPPEPPRRDIAGVPVAAVTRDEALALIEHAFDGGGHLHLAYCNANLVNIAARDAALRTRLAGFLILPDGIGVDIASRLLYGAPFPANLNGTDFTPAILSARKRPLRVMLLGGRPGIAERAAARLRADHPQHRFSVLSHGYFGPDEEAALLARLAHERPDLLLVAFGNPKQEQWIADHIDARHCAVAAGIGALFDFLAGEVARAPETFRALRIEWTYRLWLEPRRLWRRYVVGNPAFLLRVLRQKLAGRGA
ncbi:WecB/TagA/CpsF family glycosyltransferase [Bosea sp. (in: a-proteobacteria)]|uniref:WecB/TagA/CpsF family glycosyltransferase n=1 Tax=Bosea sp. (in: a-proteobacteria) TaxID=1871050 RepID=UPI001DF4A072|nr:WecB/TagA/CpsF family glycosyltransferase [Bosea sp. (in: a-proteobacteria)]MBA4223996.1 glycosyltransferase [Methylobacterium sp.]MBR3189602.1 WecB/TagA/CpsF family glycosyltransferase [Bosea sp. (in: a-proteobacteria)]